MSSTFRPMLVTILLTFATLTITRAASTQPPANFKTETAKAIAQAYHVDGFKQIQSISWTFDVTLGNKNIQRHWTWEPESGQVTLERKGHKPLTYNHKQVMTGVVTGNTGSRAQTVIQADKWFVNDSYWLLYPFQIHWSNPTLTIEGKANLPIGSGQATQVVVQFPQTGGYTPGDKYDLYLNDQHRIIQWVYHRAGKNPGRPATWENNVALGPIIICTEHKGPNGKFELKMTHLSATLANGQTVKPKPLPAPAENEK